jgi:hypothetical protein
MKIRAAHVATSACVILLGCASEGGPGGGMQRTQGDCTGASCEITVSVGCSGTLCEAKAVPKELDVLLPHGAKVIHWKLDAPDGYAFANESVQFASGAPFDCTPPGAGKRQVTCVDRHDGPGQYGYTMAVVKTGDPASRIPVDPWIVNR